MLVFLLVLISSTAFAQQFPDSTNAQKKVDRRAFSETAIENYKQDSDFNYEQITTVETYSVWDYILNFLSKLFADSGNRAVIEILLYVLCGGIILFVILRLLGISPQQLFYGKSKGEALKTDVLEEDIHGINFELEIAKAERENNWKEAIRLRYLSMLKVISDRGLIVWKINKTNHDYEIEIQQDTLKKPFHRVTQVYEYVCYGSFKIDELKYQEFKGQFVAFTNDVM